MRKKLDSDSSMSNLATIVAFLAFTFLWSWGLWIIGLIYLQKGLDQGVFDKIIVLFFAGVYGPTISAIMISFIRRGYFGVIDLAEKLFIWKGFPKAYIYLFFFTAFFCKHCYCVIQSIYRRYW